MNINTLKTLKQENALTFAQLAKLFQVSPAAVQHWQYGIRKIPGPARVLLALYAIDKELIKKVLADL